MNYEQKKRLGDLVREMREAGGHSQREYAKKFLDVSYASLRSWEEGESTPSFDNVRAIAKLKGWTLSQLDAYVEGEDLEQTTTLDSVLQQAQNLLPCEQFNLSIALLKNLESNVYSSLS